MTTDPSPGQTEHRGWGTPRPERRRIRLTRLRVLTVALSLVLAVAVGWVVVRNTFYPGADVAERIRASGSSLIVRVEYIGPEVLAPDYVHVYLRHDTTEATGNAFWCEVVVPAGGADLPAFRVSVMRDGQKPGETWNLAPDPVCTDSAPMR